MQKLVGFGQFGLPMTIGHVAIGGVHFLYWQYLSPSFIYDNIIMTTMI